MGADEELKACKSPPTDHGQNPLVLDDDGDLILVAGGRTFHNKAVFKVDASALRRASPVWKAMLFGPWSESKPKDGSKWLVRLPADDTDALTVVLGIIHNVYDSVPSDTITPTLMWKILVVCDKYDMTRILKPWALSWSKHVRGLNTNYEKAIFIAWELGDEAWFASRFKDLVFKSCVTAQGRLTCLSSGFMIWDFATLTHFGPDRMPGKTTSSLSPSSILEDIASIRLFLVESLLGFLNAEIDLRLSGTAQANNGQHACVLKDPACNDLLLGGIIRNTSMTLKTTIHPREATKIEISVESLQNACSAAFESLKPHANVIINCNSYMSASSTLHADCNPAKRFDSFILKKRAEALSKIENILQSDDYKGRMAKQRENIGWKSL
ncbi:hypothetical protein QBC36DRAFT_372454 [Triangularia setosa]|uniref:BTB domain-containing protein n=1 Tax=Triangularia setosa TaxID=2587417 RepID=A0AAN6W836_9PEZI|nr:hypothetical protein QBC36DRAFT_372454 [Podospora setosa]